MTDAELLTDLEARATLCAAKFPVGTQAGDVVARVARTLANARTAWSNNQIIPNLGALLDALDRSLKPFDEYIGPGN